MDIIVGEITKAEALPENSAKISRRSEMVVRQLASQ
jgi:hypothetical protein